MKQIILSLIFSSIIISSGYYLGILQDKTVEHYPMGMLRVGYVGSGGSWGEGMGTGDFYNETINSVVINETINSAVTNGTYYVIEGGVAP
jgi:hypothetical protein